MNGVLKPPSALFTSPVLGLGFTCGSPVNSSGPGDSCSSFCSAPSRIRDCPYGRFSGALRRLSALLVRPDLDHRDGHDPGNMPSTPWHGLSHPSASQRQHRVISPQFPCKGSFSPRCCLSSVRELSYLFCRFFLPAAPSPPIRAGIPSSLLRRKWPCRTFLSFVLLTLTRFFPLFTYPTQKPLS